MPNPRLTLTALLTLCLVALPTNADQARPPGLDDVRTLGVGTPFSVGDLIVVPITRPDALPDANIETARRLATVAITADVTPDADAVLVHNRTNLPVLVAGGEIFEGGTRDRLVHRSVLIAPKATLRVPALSASFEDRVPAETTKLVPARTWAPQYLRASSPKQPSPKRVEAFVKRMGDLLPEDAVVHPALARLARHPGIQRYCVECAGGDALAGRLSKPDVVGAATFVHGHLHGIDIFASHKIWRAQMRPLMRSHVFRMAALTIRARVIGMPMYDYIAPAQRAERAHTLTLAAVRELAEGRNVTSDEPLPGSMGTVWTVETSQGAARVLAHGDRLVHLALFPRDAYGDRLFALMPGHAESAAPPKGDPGDAKDGTDGEPGAEELERRGKAPGQRLTEAEKRRRERLKRLRDAR